MADVRIPAAVAVALWGATALAVLGYTVKSYKETASGSVPHPLSKGEQRVADFAADAPALVSMDQLARQAPVPGPATVPRVRTP
jgi:hypothetical protein